MKNWWRKWSYDVPLFIGDALWAVLVVQFADFLSRLTIRRVLEFFVIAMLAMAFAQTFPIDLAILFAGDTLMYLEIVTIVRLAAGREHFYQMLRLVARLARFAMRVLARRGRCSGFADQSDCASGAMRRVRNPAACPIAPTMARSCVGCAGHGRMRHAAVFATRYLIQHAVAAGCTDRRLRQQLRRQIIERVSPRPVAPDKAADLPAEQCGKTDQEQRAGPFAGGERAR